MSFAKNILSRLLFAASFVMAAFAACWSPPSPDPARRPVDLTFQVSFKRSGELYRGR